MVALSLILPVSNPLSDNPSWPEPQTFLAARSGVARRLALLATGIAGGLFALERVMGVPLDADSVLLAVLSGMGLLAWGLLKTRHFAIVSWMVVATLFAMVVISTVTFGSVRTVNVALIVVALVAVGLLLSCQALIWTTTAAVLLLGGLTWADAAGWLLGQPAFEVGWRTWWSQAGCVVGVAVMMYLSRTQMSAAQRLHVDEAIARLQAQLDRDLEQERFSRVFQSSPAPIFVQSARTGVILDVNPAFERTLGYRRKEVVNKRDGFLWQHDKDHEAFSRERRLLRRTAWHPITAICRNGQTLSLHICSQRDDDPQDSLVITALRQCGAAPGPLPAPKPPGGGRAAIDWQALDSDHA